MPELVAIKYAEETIAGQAAQELERQREELDLDPDAIGVIVCSRDGSCQLMTSHHPGAKADWSRFWGVTLGAVMGGAPVQSMDSTFLDQINNSLTPGSSVLFIVVAKGRPARAIDAVSQYGGAWLKTSLSAEVTDELREAL